MSEQGKPYTVTENVWIDDVLVYAVNEVISYEDAVRVGLIKGQAKPEPENKIVEAPTPRTTRKPKPKE